MKNEDILIIDENNIQIKNDNKSSGKINMFFNLLKFKKKTLLSDTFIDLKVITVPVVSLHLLPEMIINSIKRVTTSQPSKNDIDFLILEKNNSKYEILIFIKHDISGLDFSELKIFSIYHILKNLMHDKEFPDDASFIVREKKVIFIYSFRNRIFKKRSIYFDNDIESLKNQSLYYFPLYNEDKNIPEGFIGILPDKISRAISSLNKEIFVQNKNQINIFMVAGISLFALFLVLFLEIYLYKQNQNIKNMNTEISKNENILKGLKSNRGINEELYKKYQDIMTKKSYVNTLFNLIYYYGKNNIMINGLSCDGKKFSINGTCFSDAQLENSLRTTNYFKNVSFYFSRKDNQIYFRIDGEINYEN